MLVDALAKCLPLEANPGGQELVKSWNKNISALTLKHSLESGAERPGFFSPGLSEHLKVHQWGHKNVL